MREGLREGRGQDVREGWGSHRGCLVDVKGGGEGLGEVDHVQGVKEHRILILNHRVIGLFLPGAGWWYVDPYLYDEVSEKSVDQFHLIVDAGSVSVGVDHLNEQVEC